MGRDNAAIVRDFVDEVITQGNIEAAAQYVRVWGMVIDRLEDGRIKDTRIIMDTLGMMAQPGVLPPQATP
jgi:hypothetical protein